MSGISNIVEMINHKTAEKEQEIIKEAERHKKLKMEEAQRRADDAAQKILKKAEAEVKAELSRYEASAKLQSKYQMLDAKEALIESVLNSAVEKARGIVGKAEYSKVLTRLAVDGGEALEADSIELIAPQGHAKHLDAEKIQTELAKTTGKKVKVQISKETVRSMGGVIVRTADGAKWVDNTFDARLERMSSSIRDKISSMLFEKEEEK